MAIVRAWHESAVSLYPRQALAFHAASCDFFPFLFRCLRSIIYDLNHVLLVLVVDGVLPVIGKPIILWFKIFRHAKGFSSPLLAVTTVLSTTLCSVQNFDVWWIRCKTASWGVSILFYNWSNYSCILIGFYYDLFEDRCIDDINILFCFI